MEKESAVSVVPADFGWSDLGSWTAAWELSERNADGNTVENDAVTIDVLRGPFPTLHFENHRELAGLETRLQNRFRETGLSMPSKLSTGHT